jgi:branched-chain amino acid transport system substrate-binding protein
MTEQAEKRRVSRRAFLRTAGYAAGALAAAPLIGPAAGSIAAVSAPGSAPAGAPVSIGVLLPQSQFYPDLARNFLAGMQLYLAQAHGRAGGRPIVLLTRDYGRSTARALDQSRELIEQARADLLVSTLSSGIAASLDPLLREWQVPLVVSGAGANVTRQDRESPYIFRNSLNFWRSSWALGGWAARNLGTKALIATSFYDSGYDAYYTFQLGFESAGGTIAQTRVTHRPTDTPDHLAALMSDIRQTRPDLVFAAYSGRDAVDFVRAYDAAGLSARIPLVGSGFLVDEQQMPELGGAARGIKTVLPWASTLSTAENQAFTAAFQSAAGRPADIFAVLGYDTAHLVIDALDAVNGDPRQSEQLRQALAHAAFAGPRGLVTMDPATLDAVTPLYLREVRGGGSPRNEVVAELGMAPMLDERFAALRAATKTGWENNYLCV